MVRLEESNVATHPSALPTQLATTPISVARPFHMVLPVPPNLSQSNVALSHVCTPIFVRRKQQERPIAAHKPRRELYALPSSSPSAVDRVNIRTNALLMPPVRLIAASKLQKTFLVLRIISP